jgi:hypothetical protein
MLDGAVAAVFSAAFSGFYLDATLHRATFTDDGMGGGSATFGEEAVKAQLDATTQAQRAAEGYTDTDQRILVLASGVDEITTDDEITVNDKRWAIASVSRDPAGAYYDLRGRLSGVEAS